MSPALPTPVLLVGGGKMGSALAAGWLREILDPDALYVVEPDDDRREGLDDIGVRHRVASTAGLPSGFEAGLLLLAVKPQMMDEAQAACVPRVNERTIVLSIAAGRTLASFARAFGPRCAIVRAMPNTPAAVGSGASVLVANAAASDRDREVAGALLGAVGEVFWVEDEELLHTVTALSGGGPAYVFLLIECLARAGTSQGLPVELARRLARATVIGSGELARRAAEEPETLRQNVTSPGGTTAEALRVLMGEEGLQPMIDRALAAAADRSRQLGG